MTDEYKDTVKAWEKIQRMCIDAEQRDIDAMRKDVEIKENIIKEKIKYLQLLEDTLQNELKTIK